MQAYEDFEKAMKVNQSHPDLFCHRGQFHLLQNQFSQASFSRLYTSGVEMDGHCWLTMVP